jgi:electron transport complex protein RnfG
MMGLFALLGAGGVIAVHQLTEARIAENQRQDALAAIHRLLPGDAYDNELLAQPVEFAIQRDGRGVLPVTAYLALLRGQPVATLMQLSTPDGYNGEIQLLLAVRPDGQLTGVEVIAHRETPGLGDRIESQRSDWLRQFQGASLENPGLSGWKVKRDGGRFDQLSGATVTPRAVVQAVRDALAYLRMHQMINTKSPQIPAIHTSRNIYREFG